MKKKIKAWVVIDSKGKICKTPVSYFVEADSPIAIYTRKNALHPKIQKTLKLKIVECEIIIESQDA